MYISAKRSIYIYTIKPEYKHKTLQNEVFMEQPLINFGSHQTH